MVPVHDAAAVAAAAPARPAPKYMTSVTSPTRFTSAAAMIPVVGASALPAPSEAPTATNMRKMDGTESVRTSR